MNIWILVRLYVDGHDEIRGVFESRDAAVVAAEKQKAEFGQRNRVSDRGWQDDYLPLWESEGISMSNWRVEA